MASGYDVELVERTGCGPDIVTLRFSRPEAYQFTAGQWFTLRLETSDGPRTETFSHCSAPSDPYLEMTTRLSASPFKQALAVLEPGAMVHIVGPGGHLSLPDSITRVCFLVGGVGITPIHGILRDAVARGRVFEDALLLFGNRDESCVPFGDEFAKMSSIGVRTQIVYERPSAEWTGERGFITAEIVCRHLDIADERPFVVTGPPVMVVAMEHVLDDLRIPDELRIVERFGTLA